MRVANVNDRLHLQVGDGFVDVEMVSNGRFSSDPQGAFENWDELLEWGSHYQPDAVEIGRTAQLGAPVPRPRQVFAIALNYRTHVLEAGREMPTSPGVFTKFPSCLVGPQARVYLPTETVDWEAELVVVIGRRACDVSEGEAWRYVAGVTAGQDISERELQLGGKFPQLALAKSMPGFGPLGPVLVSCDELANPDDLALTCVLNGEVQQNARTSDLVFAVPELIARISRLVPMLPGDLIFTGTPGGVGAGHVPPSYLKDGDVLETTLESVGTMRNVMTTDRASATT